LVIFAPGVDETTALVFAGNMNSGRQAVKPPPLPSSPATGAKHFAQESACDEYFRYFVSNAYAPFQSSGGVSL
jgi:hypothetical protein